SFFFFSSRRRHTRSTRDWSSDVCSSDLYRVSFFLPLVPSSEVNRYREKLAGWEEKTHTIREEIDAIEQPKRKAIIKEYVDKYPRSEERRVGKEGRSRITTKHQKKKKE